MPAPLSTTNKKHRAETNLFVLQQQESEANQGIEGNLTTMQMEFKRITEELDRLPEHGKKIAIINKRRDLERSQEDLRKKIA